MFTNECILDWIDAIINICKEIRDAWKFKNWEQCTKCIWIKRKTQRLIGKPLTTMMYSQPAYTHLELEPPSIFKVMLFYGSIPNGIPELTKDMSDIFITSLISINHYHYL